MYETGCVRNKCSIDRSITGESSTIITLIVGFSSHSPLNFSGGDFTTEFEAEDGIGVGARTNGKVK